MEQEYSANLRKAAEIALPLGDDEEMNWLSSSEVLALLTSLEQEYSASLRKVAEIGIPLSTDEEMDWLSSPEDLSAIRKIEDEYFLTSCKSSQTTQPPRERVDDDSNIHVLRTFETHYEHLIGSIRSAKKKYYYYII